MEHLINSMEFRDLKTQYRVLGDAINNSIAEVMESAAFISGSQVRLLEKRLAEYTGVRHCITCANGTDAITLGLMAWEIGVGDAVFVPDFTFFSSGECPAGLGATPIFVDIKADTFNMDPAKLEEAVLAVIEEGKLTPRAVVAVDLFGQPAEYERLREICRKYQLRLLEDGAQGFGGSINGKMACSFGDISTTSFFPAKPLGCYGDGGAVFTDNDEWAERIRSLAVHGKNRDDKYDNIRIGMNSRLDTLQATVLLPKLDAFKNYELERVNQVAKWYNDKLKDTGLALPRTLDGYLSSWAQYTVLLPEDTDREQLQQALKEKGIPTNIYYRKPMHLQGAFAGTRSGRAECPVTEMVCRRALSLPMGPYLSYDEVGEIAGCLWMYVGE